MNKIHVLNYVGLLIIAAVNFWEAEQGTWMTAAAVVVITGIVWFLGVSFGRMKQSEDELERLNRWDHSVAGYVRCQECLAVMRPGEIHDCPKPNAPIRVYRSTR